MQIRDKGMEDYILLLEGLERLFYNLGSKWEQWMRKDIQDFKTNEEVVHHLRAYGEWGGLNGVYFSGEDYNLPKGSELWINKLLKEMLKLTYYFAGEFHRGEQVSHTELIRMLDGKKENILCNKCLHCKYGSVRLEIVETFLMEQIICRLMKLYLERGDLRTLVDRFCTFKIPELEEQKNGLIQAFHGKNIQLDASDEKTLICPRCGNNRMNIIEYRVNKVNMLYTERYLLTPAYVNI